MSGQEWATLAIAGTAAAWLAWRWRKRGLGDDDDAARGCGSCAKSKGEAAVPLRPLAPERADDARRERDAQAPERRPPARP